jgi:glucokinase
MDLVADAGSASMDVGNIAELNTFLLLDAIRSHGEATRRQLGRELGLSDASVSRIVKRLLASGIIEELPGAGTDGAAAPGAGGPGAVRGRTPSILRFVGPAGAVIAVDLGGTRCHGALADLAGGPLAMDFRHLSDDGDDGDGSSDDAVGTLLRCIAALRSRAAELAMPVRAVVVGIPALIDPVSQLATAGPNVRWQGFDLLAILGDQLAEPFEVDNDVNLAALGEAWRGQGRGVQSFVTMSLGTGIGGAVVIDGHLVRGAHNAAGEVAYFPFWRPQRRLGFEDVASGPALRARAAELLHQGRSTSLDPAGFEVADIFAAAAAGDLLGEQVVGEVVTYVAAAIVGITALVDPERVILDGAIGRALAPWLAGLRSAVEAGVFRPPDIVISSLGPDAAVTGAMARALALVSELDVPAHLSRHVMRPAGAPPHHP